MHAFIKSLSRIAEFSLSPISRAVRREKLTYLNVLKLRRLERALEKLESSNVPGALLEFGVALGGSAIILATHARRHSRQFHGFDVFATIPPPTSDKDDDKSRERFRLIAAGEAKGIDGGSYYGYEDNLLEQVKASMAHFGVPVDDANVQLHQGLFEDCWPEADINAIAFAHIDCDWYDPVAFCLAAIADRLTPGGIILLDDYNDYGGARQAVDEFRIARGDFVFEKGINPILRKKTRAG